MISLKREGADEMMLNTRAKTENNPNEHTIRKLKVEVTEDFICEFEQFLTTHEIIHRKYPEPFIGLYAIECELPKLYPVMCKFNRIENMPMVALG